MFRIVLVLLLFSPALAFADQFSDAIGQYRVLSTSRIHFSVAQLGGEPIEGEFKRFKGTFELYKDIGRSKVDFSLEPASVAAADPRIEEFIKSEQVFNVAEFPTVSFRSTHVTRDGDSKAAVEGKLTAKGLTRTTTFSIAYEGKSGANLKFHVTGKLSRAIFKMDVGIPIYSNYVVLDMDLVGQRM